MGRLDNILDGWTGNISVADLNRDGLPDILMYWETDTPPAGGIEVSLGTDGGGWTSVGSMPVVDYNNNFVADFNEDGVPDLLAQPLPGNPLEIFLGNGDGTFSNSGAPVGGDGSSVDAFSIGDLNEDDHLDILLNDGWWSDSDSWVVLLGRGDGTFADGAPVSLGISTPYALQDLNGDGHLDYVGASGTLNNYSAIRIALGKWRWNVPTWV